MARILYELSGYVSAMEGFILISGLTCAIAYFDPAHRKERQWARCGTLYLRYVVIWTGALWSLEVTSPQWKGFLAHFQARTRVAVQWVLVLGWHALFFGGIWAGVLRREGNSLGLLSNCWLLATCAAIAVAGFVPRHQGNSSLLRIFAYEAWPISKEHLGAVRLLNTAAIAVLVWRIPAAVYHTAGGIPVAATGLRSLVYLGQHLLAVSGWHVLVTSLPVAAWVHDSVGRRFLLKVTSADHKPRRMGTA